MRAWMHTLHVHMHACILACMQTHANLHRRTCALTHALTQTCRHAHTYVLVEQTVRRACNDCGVCNVCNVCSVCMYALCANWQGIVELRLLRVSQLWVHNFATLW